MGLVGDAFPVAKSGGCNLRLVGGETDPADSGRGCVQRMQKTN